MVVLDMGCFMKTFISTLLQHYSGTTGTTKIQLCLWIQFDKSAVLPSIAFCQKLETFNEKSRFDQLATAYYDRPKEGSPSYHNVNHSEIKLYTHMGDELLVLIKMF